MSAQSGSRNRSHREEQGPRSGSVPQLRLPQKMRGATLAEDGAAADMRVGLFDFFEVVSVTEFGAFLSWGLPKDLFVPWTEQKRPMKEGESHIVYVYRDEKTGRIAGSSKINKFLDLKPMDLCEHQTVDLLIGKETDMGYNAIINNSFSGLLYKTEVFQPLRYGQRIKGCVKKVRPDGKIDLCLERPGYHAVEGVSQKILEHLKAHGGVSDLSDKTLPEKIYQLFGISKKKFKMAIGLLFKERLILVEKDRIVLVATVPVQKISRGKNAHQ